MEKVRDNGKGRLYTFNWTQQPPTTLLPWFSAVSIQIFEDDLCLSLSLLTDPLMSWYVYTPLAPAGCA
jgi:hypothetical protein